MYSDYSNRPDFLPGRDMTSYVLDLDSEMVSFEQSWQTMMDTEGTISALGVFSYWVVPVMEEIAVNLSMSQ
jgi:hypothetical protein